MARDTHICVEIDSTRGDGRAIIPKVKRVQARLYCRRGFELGGLVPSKSATAERFMGHPCAVPQSGTRHHREGYTARRGETAYEVSPTSVRATSQTFAKVVEVPARARNVRFFYRDAGELPSEYRHAMQDVR